jgi:hypothetical protein
MRREARERRRKMETENVMENKCLVLLIRKRDFFACNLNENESHVMSLTLQKEDGLRSSSRMIWRL